MENINLSFMKIKINEELTSTGKKYNDEVTKFLITGENVAKTDSEKILITDVIYLLTKIDLMERYYFDEIMKLHDLIDNISKYGVKKQTTIDDRFGLSEDK